MTNSIFSLLPWRRFAGSVAVAFLLKASFALCAAEEPPLKICLLSASTEYDSEKSLGEFQKYLESRYRILCQRAFGKDKGDNLPGIEALDHSDLMIVFTRRVALPAAQLETLKKYLASGKPVIGLRTASHAFQNYPEFDREILGGGYKGHYTNAEAMIELSPGRSAHPVLAGVTDFTSRKLYKNPTLADDVVVLLAGATGAIREPVAWVRERNGARIFYTSLGTQEDFQKESFQQLLVNAIFWTTRQDHSSHLRSGTTKQSTSAHD